MARSLLTSVTTFYYDNVNGNDANSGLSPAAAWKTLTGAFNNLRDGYDLGGIPGHTLQLCTTNPAAADGVNWYSRLEGQAGRFNIVGSFSAPNQCTFKPTAGNPFAVSGGGSLYVRGVMLDTSLSNQDCLTVGDAGDLGWDTIYFGQIGPQAYHMTVSEGGTMLVYGNSAIYGSGGCGHISVGTGGRLVYETNGAPNICSISVYGSQGFSTGFACADDDGLLQILATPIVLATGASVSATRFLVQNGGRIDTGGQGPNYFPGTAPGVNLGGFYS